jgi:hypothetical protein
MTGFSVVNRCADIGSELISAYNFGIPFSYRLVKYIPKKERRWTPVDEALYGVEDIMIFPKKK